ncbi:MAG: UDP-N-acetylmuramoyl-tripeptide--D-alanyl-D-alanine ligase [Myxococcales bacterium]|nr:UDP-N-acetylmuramoyl-tripeptide--D-alanyl-D-alanine ligase [Myxococcales bacterium]MDH3485963.1 UDP-N-acetylmuramoyl-tripeptide--D-alanyl-D-alanine ligase [Myxococcales bacterium]
MATAIPSNEASFQSAQIAAVTGGNLSGPPWESVAGVVTDSRAVADGNLFVALRGEHFDAHDFVEQAAGAGATAVMVARGTTLPDHISAVHVDDTLRALGDLAHAHRNAWTGTVIGITGSVGKTTTKDLAAAALDATGRKVLKTAGNLNNRIGVPMTILQLGPSFDTAVIEMGSSEPGEIARLAEIAAPDVGVVTRATLAHTEGLGSVEAVADEKMALLRALGPDGIAVTYGDDSALKKRAAVVMARRKLFYGRAAENDVRVLDWKIDQSHTQASLQVRGQATEVILQLLGEGAVLNAAAALATVFGLELSLEDAVRGMATLEPSPGRLHPRSGAGTRLVIDDTYNANPASVEVAVATARAVADQRGAPLVVVLGDMKELGARSAEAHRKVGELVADADAFLFIGCGDAMHESVDVANARGIDTLWFEDAADCSQLSDRLPLNAVVLVKGSRSMEMERAIAPMLEEEDRR